MARLCRCFMMNYVRSLCLRIWSVMAISLKFFKILLRAYLTWYRFKTICAQIENNSQFDHWWVYLNPSHKKREQSKMLKSPVVKYIQNSFGHYTFSTKCVRAINDTRILSLDVWSYKSASQNWVFCFYLR